MEKTVEDINPTKKRFTLEVPAEILEQRITDALKDIGRSVKLPGFRPGRAPLSLLEKRYGKEVETDVLQKAIPEYYLKAIREANVVPVMPPVFEGYDFKRKEPLKLTFTVEIRPEIENLDYQGLKVEDEPVEVTDEDIERTIERLQTEKSSYESIKDDIVRDDDLVVVDYEIVEEEQNVTGQFIKIGSDIIPQEISDALKGKRVDDPFEVRATFPDEYINKNLSGKTLTLKGSIREIRRLKKAELTDDFAKELGYDDMEKLREAVREGIVKVKEELIENKQKVSIIEQLLQRHDFDLPEGLVSHELNMLVHEQKRLKPDADEEELREELKEKARKNVKTNIILDTIADREGVEVTDEEVRKKIVETANSMYLSPEHFMQMYLPNEEALYEFRQSIRREKTLDILLKRTKEGVKGEDRDEIKEEKGVGE